MGKYWERLNGLETVADQAPAPSGGKYWARVNGTQPQEQQVAATVDQNAAQGEAMGGGVVGRVAQAIKGNQDPAYADTGTVYDQFTDSWWRDNVVGKSRHGAADLATTTSNAALMGASDAQMADVIQKRLGDRFLRREKDANGYDIFVTKADDGSEQRGYVNKPGLDTQDIVRGIYGAVPYAATGGAAYGVTGGLPLAAQVAAQGATAGATSLGGDVGLQTQGSDQGLELGKAAFATGGGMAGPIVGAGVQRFVANRAASQMLDDAGGLSPKGVKVASQAGLDPTTITPEAAKAFARTYSMSGDATEAATRSASQPFGIPVSRGQVTKRPDLLTQEEGMRRNLYGDQARQTMEAFDKEQAFAIKDAALGPKIAGMVAPNRAPASRSFDANPATLGTSIREGLESATKGAKEGQQRAWGEIPQMKATSEALEMLPDVVQKRLGGIIVDENTPQALKMDAALGAFLRGETPQAATQVVKNAPIKDVDRMRRRLLDMSRAQTTPEDERAAAAIYDAFNDWIDEAAAKNLLSGDAEMAAKLKVARGFTREVKQLFEPRDDRGALTAGGQRLAKALDIGRADSPEALIDSLLASQGSRTVNTGTVPALRNVREILQRYADPEVGANAWNDIRLAFWVRTVQGRNGELLGPQAMLSNIKTAFSSQQSVLNTLYSAQEQAMMRSFMKALQAAAYKPPNASGSAYAGAQFMKQFVGQLSDAFGLNTVLGRTAIEYTGVGSRYGKSLARSAVNQSTRMRSRFSPSLPLFSGAGSEYGRNQED